MSEGEEHVAKRAKKDDSHATSTTFTKDGITVPLPEGWKCEGGSVLTLSYKDPKPSKKIAAFDYDGCLVNSKMGFDPNGWKVRYSDLHDKLHELVADGYQFVIFTNEV